MKFRRTYRSFGLVSVAILVAIMAGACSDDSGGNATDQGGDTAAASGCDEANALRESLTSLTQIEPVNDGLDALESAVADTKTDLEAAASAVSSELRPPVEAVQSALDDLETTLEGISSDSGLAAAATELGSALTELGSTLTDLSAEISERC
jgi:hypothetical protein